MVVRNRCKKLFTAKTSTGSKHTFLICHLTWWAVSDKIPNILQLSGCGLGNKLARENQQSSVRWRVYFSSLRCHLSSKCQQTSNWIRLHNVVHVYKFIISINCWCENDFLPQWKKSFEWYKLRNICEASENFYSTIRVSR